MRFTAAILAIAAVNACELESEAQAAGPVGTHLLKLSSIKVRDDT